MSQPSQFQKKLKDEPPPPPLEPYQAKDRAIFIRDNIKIVERLRDEGKTFDEMKEAALDFANNFPHLFIMVTTKEGYSEDTLKTMLAMIDRMASSKVSQHEASIHVGTHLKNKFVSNKD
jgi:hypothetical protein